MSKYLRIIIVLFVLNSCNNDNSQLKDVWYYPDSKIISTEKVYNSIEDKSQGNFTIIEYDSLGIKNSVYSCKNNLLEGKSYTFYPSGKILKTSNFRDGEEIGVSKIINEEGFLIKEFLYVDGINILMKYFVEYTEIKSYGYKIYPLKNDSASKFEGRIIYDTNMNIIDSVTQYYDVHKGDILKYGETNLNVKLLGTAFKEYKTNINLALGELNPENLSNNRFSLKDTTRIIKSEKNELNFDYSITNFENGLITGLLQLELFSLDGKEKIKDKYFTFYYDLNYE